jgi:hypothetical protein
MMLKIAVIGLTFGAAAWFQSPQTYRRDQAPPFDGEGLAPISASDQSLVGKALGIQILSLRLSSAASALSLRFRVIDAEKAAALFGRDRPHIISPASGLKLRGSSLTPASGSRTALPEAEGIYTITFDGATTMKQGEAVTLFVGDYRVERMTVFASVGPAAL